MPEFATIRLGKQSVAHIELLDSLSGVQIPPVCLSATARQVHADIRAGVFTLIWLGSDNNKGQETKWRQGLRAVGRVTGRIGGEAFGDQCTLEIEVGLVLPRSVSKTDFLARAAAAYYWFSSMPVLGVDDFSNQLARRVDQSAERQDVRALFYALEAAYPGLRAEVELAYPELRQMFDYAVPQPGMTHGGAQGGTSTATGSAQAGHRLPADWVFALCSRRLLIVTGPTGTGKTKTARDFARDLDYSLPASYALSRNMPANCMAFVPVGADWMDSTPLLGYPNPFGQERTIKSEDGTLVKTNETYEIPAALLLLLRAHAYPEQPHFLVLDEMNLSHAERYMHVLLSVMEADRGLDLGQKLDLLDLGTLRRIDIALTTTGDHPLELETVKKLLRVQKGLSLPSNVFIIGTVNVDETTYMFSPKVLDRAHVIETRYPNPDTYLGEPSQQHSSAGISVDGALQLLRKAIARYSGGFWDRQDPTTVLDSVIANVGLSATQASCIRTSLRRVISGVHTLLEPVGFGCSHRSINDVYAYLASYLDNADFNLWGPEGWRTALDGGVFQKLLPKIHGNRRQLGESLTALALFLRGDGATYSLGDSTVGVPPEESTGFELPQSAAKVTRMASTLQATGYTTFVC